MPEAAGWGQTWIEPLTTCPRLDAMIAWIAVLQGLCAYFAET